MNRSTRTVLVVATALASFAVHAEASECARSGTLGTARELAIDPAATPRVGLKNFPQTLPLADKEVVFTFDDGPWPATTPKVLKALADQCVHATFFLTGRWASAYPALVKRIAAEGHSVGHHTWSHRNLAITKEDVAIGEIDKGFAAVETALSGATTTTPSTPFFRFPYFGSTPALLDRLEKRRIAVFGADLWASDWEKMSPDQQLRLLTSRLNSARKGIILLHDPRAQTAAMLPAFLRYLRDNGYHVVHIVPAKPAAPPATATLSPAARHD